MRFSRQEYWSDLPFPSPGDLPNPGIEPRSLALWAVSLPAEPPGKLHVTSLSFFKYVLGWKQASWLQGCRMPWEVSWWGSFRLRVSLGLPGDAQLTSPLQYTSSLCSGYKQKETSWNFSDHVSVSYFSTPQLWKLCLLLERLHCEVCILDLGLTCHIPAFAKSIQ